MDNLRQISVVSQSFQEERKTFLIELVKVNGLIAKKKQTIERIFLYQKEYKDFNNYKLTRETPALYKNLHLFEKQIDNLIFNERNEIKRLEQIRGSIIEKIENLDQKIRLMKQFKDRTIKANLEKADKVEQFMIDDLSSVRGHGERNE